jgi:hypothetical protein
MAKDRRKVKSVKYRKQLRSQLTVRFDEDKIAVLHQQNKQAV